MLITSFDLFALIRGNMATSLVQILISLSRVQVDLLRVMGAQLRSHNVTVVVFGHRGAATAVEAVCRITHSGEIKVLTLIKVEGRRLWFFSAF